MTTKHTQTTPYIQKKSLEDFVNQCEALESDQQIKSGDIPSFIIENIFQQVPDCKKDFEVGFLKDFTDQDGVLSTITKAFTQCVVTQNHIRNAIVRYRYDTPQVLLQLVQDISILTPKEKRQPAILACIEIQKQVTESAIMIAFEEQLVIEQNNIQNDVLHNLVKGSDVLKTEEGVMVEKLSRLIDLEYSGDVRGLRIDVFHVAHFGAKYDVKELYKKFKSVGISRAKAHVILISIIEFGVVKKRLVELDKIDRAKITSKYGTSSLVRYVSFLKTSPEKEYDLNLGNSNDGSQVLELHKKEQEQLEMLIQSIRVNRDKERTIAELENNPSALLYVFGISVDLSK